MPEPSSPFGPVYTRGDSFRARAEARQRRYRAEVLGVGWDTHGHWLDADAAQAGANFVVPEAYAAARARDAAGKGVGPRTFSNMLSSQAMCFNVFAPLAADRELATAALQVVDGLAAVRSVTIEYTPAADVFGDQTGRGGVDCDVLVEAEWADGAGAVLVIETKFVEEEFSTCGFRRPGRASKGQHVCPEDVAVSADRDACAYQRQKGYAYWRRADEHRTLAALPRSGCPFGGPSWQLWTNHTLAHVEADRRGATHARYLVCAPAANDALLRGGKTVQQFQNLAADPATVGLLPLDALIDRIAIVAGDDGAWTRGLRARYTAAQSC